MNLTLQFNFPIFLRLSYLYILPVLLLQVVTVMGQSTGDFRSKASGNWSDFTTWQVYDGAVWQDAISGQVPGGTSEADANNVYLESGFTTTLTVDAVCKNLFVNSDENVLRLNLGQQTLDCFGKMALYTGAISAHTMGIAGVTNPAAPLYLFSNGSAGRIRFLGSVDRTLIEINEFGANRRQAGLRVEFALNTGVKGYINQNTRLGEVIVTSGTVIVSDLSDMRLDATGIDGQTNGKLFVKSGATLYGGKGLLRITNDVFEQLTVEDGGELLFTYVTPSLDCQTLQIDGVLGLVKSGNQDFPVSTKVGANALNSFKTIRLAGSGIKTIKKSTMINNSLMLGGTATLSSGSFALSYATGASLVYEGTTAQTTTNSEFPITNGPDNLVINNPNGLTLHANRTLNGQLLLQTGLFKLNTSNFTLGANGAITGTPSATNMVVTNGTGELRKIMSSPGIFFFPIGEISGTTEYTYGRIDLTSGTSLDASSYVGLRVIDNDHPADNGTSTDNLSRYWAVSSNVSDINFGVTLQYLVSDVNGDESKINTYDYNDETPLAIGSAINRVDALLHRIVISEITSVGFITGANRCSINNNSVDYTGTSTFCETGMLSSQITGSIATVSTGTVMYQWQEKVNNNTWQDITGVNGINYTETPNLVSDNTYSYRRVVSNPEACLIADDNISNEIEVIVHAGVTNNQIGNDQQVLENTVPDPLGSLASLSGGDDTYTYQWKESITSGGPYLNILSATDESYASSLGVVDSRYYIREVTSSVCPVSISNEVLIDLLIPTAIVEQDESFFNAYPNPVKDKLTINLTKETSKISIYNHLGILVNELSLKKDKVVELDFSQYPKGIYIVNVLVDNKVQSQKIVNE